MTKVEIVKAGLAATGQTAFVNETAEQYAKRNTKDNCIRFYERSLEWAEKMKEWDKR